MGHVRIFAWFSGLNPGVSASSTSSSSSTVSAVCNPFASESLSSSSESGPVAGRATVSWQRGRGAPAAASPPAVARDDERLGLEGMGREGGATTDRVFLGDGNPNAAFSDPPGVGVVVVVVGVVDSDSEKSESVGTAAIVVRIACVQLRPLQMSYLTIKSNPLPYFPFRPREPSRRAPLGRSGNGHGPGWPRLGATREREGAEQARSRTRDDD